ncbi:MAG: thioredoxin family protein [Thermoplasmata archaeon]|nr:thioredoxin family protein [Thermoplasmata archaeon]
MFAKLNIMTSTYTAGRYGVMSTPTFKFFCSGRPVQELVGAVYPPLLKKSLTKRLPSARTRLSQNRCSR